MNPLIFPMIGSSGRSWWQARYANGKVLSEWDTLTDRKLLPTGPGASSRWEEVPKGGMVSLRLLCPNGVAGELEAPEGHRFFQLKAGGLIGGSPGRGSQHYTSAHIIGVVADDQGNCVCRAWDYRQKRLLKFRDNVLNMKFLNIGRLNLDVQQLKV